MADNIRFIDPVQGLVDYVLDVKPYHTKIMEVLVEHVYDEYVVVNVFDNHEYLIDMTYPSTDGTIIIYFDGYSGRGFGDDTSLVPIISPDIGISAEDYPSINDSTNSFIVIDTNNDFQEDSIIHIYAYVDTEIFDIDSVGNSIVVLGHLLVSSGDTFELISSYENDGTYAVTGTPIYDGTYTTINVSTNLVNTVPNPRFGFMRVVNSNTGNYTVDDYVHNAGSIGSWPNLLDPASYGVGNSPHTIVSVVEQLEPIPTLLESQTFVAVAAPESTPIEGIVTYSNYVTAYDSSIPSLVSSPTEGMLTLPIMHITNAVGSGLGEITVAGIVFNGNIYVGDSIDILGSTGNDGRYVIMSIVPTSNPDTTIIGIMDPFDDLTVDGNISINVPANAFIVKGNVTEQFNGGDSFDVLGGNAYTNYMVLRSQYLNGKTYVRVTSDILGNLSGNIIIGIIGDVVQVTGDVTNTFAPNVSVNIVGSERNDKKYTVSSTGSTYDNSTNLTNIPVDTQLDVDVSGSIYMTTLGALKRATYGFGETRNMHGIIPPTVVYVSVTEQCVMSGIEPLALINEDGTNVLPPNGDMIAATSILDDVNFYWGDGIFQFMVQAMLPSTNEVILNGDATDTIEVGNTILMLGTNNNNNTFVVQSMQPFDIATSTSTLVVDGPIVYATGTIVGVTDNVVIVNGTAATYLSVGDTVNITGSSDNDGTYSIVSATYATQQSTLTLSSALSSNTADGTLEYIDRGGWATTP